MKRILGLFIFSMLVAGGAQAQTVTRTIPATGTYTSYSQTVPTTATTIWTAPAAGAASRVRLVAIDTAIQAGTASTVTVWCAWGTSGTNAAVIGTNGFPLNPGFDDAGFGVNQTAMNCIQAASNTHYVRFETY